MPPHKNWPTSLFIFFCQTSFCYWGRLKTDGRWKLVGKLSKYTKKHTWIYAPKSYKKHKKKLNWDSCDSDHFFVLIYWDLRVSGWLAYDLLVIRFNYARLLIFFTANKKSSKVELSFFENCAISDGICSCQKVSTLSLTALNVGLSSTGRIDVAAQLVLRHKAELFSVRLSIIYFLFVDPRYSGQNRVYGNSSPSSRPRKILLFSNFRELRGCLNLMVRDFCSIVFTHVPGDLPLIMPILFQQIQHFNLNF